jgi:ribose transport system substrate-binding protein
MRKYRCLTRPDISKGVTVRTTGLRFGAALAAGGMICGALNACSGSSAQTNAAARASSQKPVTVTLVTADIADPFFISQECGAQAAARSYNVDFSAQGTASLAYQDELDVFEAVVAKHPDAIILVPFSGTAFVQPVKQAIASGIKIILDNATLATPLGSRAYVTADYHLGQLAADGLAKEIGGKGLIDIESFEPDIETAVNRINGFKNEIAAKYPGIKIVAINYSNGSAATTASNVAAELQAHPNLAGVYATDTSTGQAAASALKAHSAQGRVKLVAYDASPEEVAGLKSGVFQGLVAQDPYQYGYSTVQYAAQLLRGQTSAANSSYEVTLGGAFINASNVNSGAIKKYLYTSSCS